PGLLAVVPDRHLGRHRAVDELLAHVLEHLGQAGSRILDEMAADVHLEALVRHRHRPAAEHPAAVGHQDPLALGGQQRPGGKAGRPGPDHHHVLVGHARRVPLCLAIGRVLSNGCFTYHRDETSSRPGGPVTHPLPPPVQELLRALRERPIEPTDKGLGLLASGPGGPTAASLAASRAALPAAGFSYPVLALRESALANNLQAMAAFCAQAGVELSPHGKTGMSPELAARQLASGSWGITVATIGQLLAYRAFGFPRLLMANELTDEAGIAWLAGELA